MPEAQVPSRRHSRSRSPQPSPPRRRDYVVSSPRPSYTGRPFVVAAVDDLSGAPSPAPQPSTWLGIGGSTRGQKSTTPCSIAQRSANLLCPHDGPYSMPQYPQRNTGMFRQAHDFAVTGTFIDGNVTYNTAPSNIFMEKLLEKTILGAEFDSSDRDPPPRCHPGTRLAVLERCLSFISNCDGVRKMRWVFGAAGVGKSAILQSVAESPELPVDSHVSIFFSVNGRDDGTRAVLTLSYQFATKFDSYRHIIETEISRDPSLLRSSMAKQFSKLIVEPFIHNTRLKSTGRNLVIVDGLDECRNHQTQQELLRLISDLCLTHPSSPLVWLIASRPEPHITSFFSRHNVIPVYEKEEIVVNTNEARADVERFLRMKFAEIKDGFNLLGLRWPEEQHIWKVASAAGGLFACAQTIIRYVGDSRVGSPVSQLSDVLHVIDGYPMTSLLREEHPMALLDALYKRILANVPHRIMVNTRKLLLAMASDWGSIFRYHIIDNFIVLCNWLGMTVDEAYAAVNHLRSILNVPRRDEAHKGNLTAFHKSFIDYIRDFSRSGFSPNILEEARQLSGQCIFRILDEVPNGIELCVAEAGFPDGNLASGPVTRDRISLTWSVEEAGAWNDSQTRLNMYKLAVEEVLNGMKREDPTFQNEFCVRFLTMVFGNYSTFFPYYQLLNVVFDKSRRPELMMHGTLKQMPLKAIAIRQIYDSPAINLQFRRPAIAKTFLCDPWNLTCQHDREGVSEGGLVHCWMTTFRGTRLRSINADVVTCEFCLRRLERQLKSWMARSHDDTALVLFTSAGYCCVEVRYVDPEDGISEWTYSFWCEIPWEERKKYGSAV